MLEFFRGRYSIVNIPPATDIISLADIKVELRIPTTITSQDASILRKLDSAVDEFMEYSQSGILNTTFNVDFYGFNNTNCKDFYYANLSLYKQNIKALNKIEYAKDGALITLNQDIYNATYTRYKSIITNKNAKNFPTDIDSDYNNQVLGVVKIEFVSGFGTASNQIPAKIKDALISYIRYYLNNTGDCGDCNGGDSGIQPHQFYSLIGEYKYCDNW